MIQNEVMKIENKFELNDLKKLITDSFFITLGIDVIFNENK